MIKHLLTFKGHISSFSHHWKLFSGTFMFAISCVATALMLEPSLLSANLVQDKVFHSETKEITRASQDFAGILPDSPFYALKEKLFTPQQVSKEDVLVSFAKVVKASQKDSSMAETLYTTFLDQLFQLSQEDQNFVFQSLLQSLDFIDIQSPVFPQVYDIFSLMDKENILIQRIVLHSYTSENQDIIQERAKTVFTELAQKDSWQSYIQNKGLIGSLQKIKYELSQPSIKDGEVFHASAESWMQDNPVWNSL